MFIPKNNKTYSVLLIHLAYPILAYYILKWDIFSILFLYGIEITFVAFFTTIKYLFGAKANLWEKLSVFWIIILPTLFMSFGLIFFAVPEITYNPDVAEEIISFSLKLAWFPALIFGLNELYFTIQFFKDKRAKRSKVSLMLFSILFKVMFLAFAFLVFNRVRFSITLGYSAWLIFFYIFIILKLFLELRIAKFEHDKTPDNKQMQSNK